MSRIAALLQVALNPSKTPETPSSQLPVHTVKMISHAGELQASKNLDKRERRERSVQCQERQREGERGTHHADSHSFSS